MHEESRCSLDTDRLHTVFEAEKVSQGYEPGCCTWRHCRPGLQVCTSRVLRSSHEGEDVDPRAQRALKPPTRGGSMRCI